ncbi:DUF2723 domain-containing protein [bacterium]|nr:DUF2723 domain-containing protein [bacterium]MBU1598675.1 DUF2723 domain-containing protein [bacterium]
MMAIICFFISLACYLLTLTPSVDLHDSGEMVAAVWLLGISHPPGYPLYCLVGKLWTSLIPFGNIAYRMNIFSAVAASFAVMFVYLITLKLISFQFAIRNSQFAIISSFIASMVFAFSRIFWQQATFAEKYTLNAFFLSLLIFILLKWQESQKSKVKSQKYLYLFTFVTGLSFAHHLQTIFIVPSAIFLILTTLWNHRDTETQRKKKNPLDSQISQIFSIRNSQSAIRNFFILFAFPLSLYLYLPIRASTHPAANWGSPDTLTRFINHITAKEYGHYFAPSQQWFGNFISHITQFFSHQFTLPLLIIGLAGAGFLFAKNRRLFIFFSLIILCDILSSIRYAIHNIEDYYIPTFLVLSIFIGYAVYSFGFFLSKRLSTFYSLLSTLIITLPFLTNYYCCNRGRDFYSYDYGMNILRPLQNNGILLIMGDTFAFPLWYLHFVERARDDVSLIDKLELRYDWYCKQMKEIYPELEFAWTENRTSSPELIGTRFLDIVKKNGQDRPIYVPLPFADEARAGYELIPEGICHRIISKGADTALEMKKGEFSFKIRATGVFMEERTRNNWDNYFIGYESRAGFLAERRFYDEAIGYYHKALTLDPKRPGSLYSLGLVYKDKGELDEAEKIFKELGNRADGHYGLGMIYQKKGEFSKAILEYKKAIELDPTKIFLHHSLGAVLLEMEDYEGAVSAFKGAISYQPNDPSTYYNLGITYWKMGKIDEAISAYRKVLELNPNFPGASASLQTLLDRN